MVLINCENDVILFVCDNFNQCPIRNFHVTTRKYKKIDQTVNNNDPMAVSNVPRDARTNNVAALGRRPADPLKTPALGVPESAAVFRFLGRPCSSVEEPMTISSR